MSQANHSKLKRFFTSCSLSKVLVFGLLCALAGSLVTFFIVGHGSYAPIGEGIRAALRRCFRAHSPYECESHFNIALAEWIVADDYEFIGLNATKLVGHLDWKNMKVTVAKMGKAVAAENPVDLGNILEKMLRHLNKAMSEL